MIYKTFEVLQMFSDKNVEERNRFILLKLRYISQSESGVLYLSFSFNAATVVRLLTPLSASL